MAKIVIAHGGTLDKFIGDAVLVFFGDPESRGAEADALACVEMAVEMAEAIDDLNAHWEKKGIGSGFQVRMGVTTGYCTVGNFGSDQRMDYTIIGNQVNLASRLESAAEPGTVLIAHETWLLVRDQFDCVSRAPLQVKGFDRPIQSYAVSRRRSSSESPSGMEEAEPGFSLSLDPSIIADDRRTQVVERLNEAIERLQS